MKRAVIHYVAATMAFAYAAGCATSSKTTMVLDYEDFGPQAAAYETIGMAWWQWERQGDPDPNHRYDIKVVVYRGIPLEQVQARYPVVADKKQDYRYVSYDDAMKYLDRQIQENVLPEVTQRLRATQSRIQDALASTR